MITKSMHTSELLKRTVGFLMYGPLFLVLLLFGGIPLLAGALAVTALAAFEFYRMEARGGRRPHYVVGTLLALLFVVDAYVMAGLLVPSLAGVLLFLLACVVLERVERRRQGGQTVRRSFDDWGVTLVGALYAGVLMSHAILLRALERGDVLLLTVALGAGMCDAAAYLIGSRFGRRKFAPRISPRKTWEGTIAGVITAVLTVTLVSSLAGFGLVVGLGWGLLLGIFQIAGDLAESMIKRRNGVKDSGALIPGQGGILDVLDGFLFSVVVSYYYVFWVIRPF